MVCWLESAPPCHRRPGPGPHRRPHRPRHAWRQAREQVAALLGDAPPPGRVHVGRDRGGQRRHVGGDPGATRAGPSCWPRWSTPRSATSSARAGRGRARRRSTAWAASTPPRSRTPCEDRAGRGRPPPSCTARRPITRSAPCNPWREVVEVCRRHDALVHVDACMAAGHVRDGSRRARRRSRVGERPQAGRPSRGRCPGGPARPARRALAGGG